MKTLNATNEEAKRFSELKPDEHGFFWKLLKQQPPDGYKYNPLIGIPPGKNALFYRWNTACRINLQYPVGSVVGIKGTWDYKKEYPVYDGRTIENLMIPEVVGFRYGNEIIKKHPAKTMPQEAIRTRIKIIGNTVKRVQDINGFEWEKLGASMNYYETDKNGNWLFEHGDVDMNVVIYQFNSLHAKPRKWKKGTEFVCYPYSDESFNTIYKGDDRYKIFQVWKDSTAFDYEYTWKGKLLTIKANPFGEFVEYVKEM